MAINLDELQRHVADHNRCTIGEHSTLFVCPLTLMQCPESELIDGHVLNEALTSASRAHVIQWQSIDQWYGKTIERRFCRVMNVAGLTPAQLMRRCDFYLWLKDGTDYQAHWEKDWRAKGMAEVPNIADLTYETPAGPKRFFVRGLKNDDSRLDYSPILSLRIRVDPMIRTAAVLKAAILTLFRLLGYSILTDPLISSVRERLAAAFLDKANVEDLRKYFGVFERSFSLDDIPLGNEVPPPLLFNTLDDNICIVLSTPDGLNFAVAIVFLINGRTVTVTVPIAGDRERMHECWALYQSYLADPEKLPHSSSLNKYVGGRWEYAANINTTYDKSISPYNLIKDGVWQFPYQPRNVAEEE